MFKQFHNTGQSLREESKTAVWTYFLYSRSSDLFFEGNSEINDQSHKQILTSLLTWVSFTLGTKLRWRSITTSNLLFSSFFSSLFRSRNKTSITYNDTIFSTDQFEPVKALQKVLVLSQRHFPNGDFPSDNFPSCNFPKCNIPSGNFTKVRLGPVFIINHLQLLENNRGTFLKGFLNKSNP